MIKVFKYFELVQQHFIFLNGLFIISLVLFIVIKFTNLKIKKLTHKLLIISFLSFSIYLTIFIILLLAI